MLVQRRRRWTSIDPALAGFLHLIGNSDLRSSIDPALASFLHLIGHSDLRSSIDPALASFLHLIGHSDLQYFDRGRCKTANIGIQPSSRIDWYPLFFSSDREADKVQSVDRHRRYVIRSPSIVTRSSMKADRFSVPRSRRRDRFENVCPEDVFGKITLHKRGCDVQTRVVTPSRGEYRPLTLCRFNAGTAYATLSQHYAGIDGDSRRWYSTRIMGVYYYVWWVCYNPRTRGIENISLLDLNNLQRNRELLIQWLCA